MVKLLGNHTSVSGPRPLALVGVPFIVKENCQSFITPHILDYALAETQNLPKLSHSVKRCLFPYL